MPERILNIGFIGTGGIATMHAQGMLVRADLFRLLGAADTNVESLKMFGKHFGVPRLSTDYTKIINDPEIDALAILLPHNLHEKACLEAFASGKHVLLEKPIARTIAETDSILHGADKAGKTLMVAHNQRYYPQHRKVRELLENNALGKIFCARVDHHQDFNRAEGSWWRSREAVGGGCVIGSGIHRLDILRWLLGDVDEVFAYQTEDKRRLEAEVACVSVMRFKSGVIAEFFCNWGVYNSPDYETLSIFGQDGSLYLNDLKLMMVNHKTDPENKLVAIPEKNGSPSMWEHFYDCVIKGTQPISSGWEARKSLELVLAINKSAETGVPVRLTV